MMPTALARAAGLVVLAVLGAGCAASASPAGSGRLDGESQALAGGRVQSWVRVDGEGRPIALGLTLDEVALAGLVPDSAITLRLRVPEVVHPFDHVELRWVPRGHEPAGAYEAPHLAVHFFLVSPLEREAITDSALAAQVPALEHVPAGYVPRPGLLPYAGARWVDVTAAAPAGTLLTNTLRFGYYVGRLVFVEPSITRAFLERRPDLTAEIKQPRDYATAGRYPTRYRVRYDASAREYSIALEGLVLRP